MPPKAKFKKEEIVSIALEIVRKNGFEALTARALGEQLGSSACPIFTAFKNMEEVQEEVLLAAKAVYKEYVEKGLLETPAFRGVGTQYINFAVNEPKLFQLLFMAEQKSNPDFENILQMIDESYDKILESITDGYGVTNDCAKNLYQHLWIYTHGIATLCATKMCRFTGEEITDMLTEVCKSLLQKDKRGQKQ